ncbi:MAG: hypothetical protein SNJ74_08545 [Fimbriimonadaceae bacterium]
MTASFRNRDRDVLRRLAAALRERADLPAMAERRRAWYAHNALETCRPLVVCFPEGAWSEIFPASALECETDFARELELEMRMRLFTCDEIGDDSVVEPVLDVRRAIDLGNFGYDIPVRFGDNRGSYVWEPPIQDLGTAPDRLRYRQPRCDEAETDRRLALAEEMVGDLLVVRPRSQIWWSLGLTWKIIELIGLEALMMAMIDEPDNLHRLMAWMRDEHLHYIGWFEERGLLSPNHADQYVGSGGFGYTNELQPNGSVRLADIWGFAESQETVGISPGMFAEFVLPYQLPILEKFGLNCYGCCEPLHQRWQNVQKVPRLRRVSVSPWADQERMAEYLGRDYVYSRKPNPAPVCIGFDEDAIRKDIAYTLEVARGCCVEIILKDTHTVEGDPTRFRRWVAIARDEIARR